MTDLLVISYDFDENTDEKALCITRSNYEKDIHTVIRMLVGDKAEELYRQIIDEEGVDNGTNQ